MAAQNALKDGNGVASAIFENSSVSGETRRGQISQSSGRILVSTDGSLNAGFQQPSGTVNGVNTVFVFSITPDAISVDHMTFQKTSSDGTANWTGTTTVTLAVAPTTDIFGIA